MKKYTVRVISILLITALLMSMLAASVFAYSLNLAELAANEDENLGGIYEVQDIISLIEPERHTIQIPVADMTAEELQKKIAGGIVLQLDRDPERPYLDSTLYPHQSMGGNMGDTAIWKTQRGSALFRNFVLTAGEENGAAVLTVAFDSDFYFSNTADRSVPHAIGGIYLDTCGWFKLTAKAGDLALGTADLKVAPYDSFHTMGEIYTEIDDIVALANQNGLYAVRESMGTSTAGRDTPYIIISDSESSVADWLAFTEAAETAPTQTLADLEAGVYDQLRVPVLYSNIHAFEVAAADGIMMLAETLAETGIEGTLSYQMLTGFTAAGEAQLRAELNNPNRCVGKGGYGVAVPDLVKDTATYLGYLQNGNGKSGYVDLNKFYEQEEKLVSMRELLGGVFFILVPEESVDGRVYIARTAANGYDLNRDNSFQTTPETANMLRMIGTYNPVCFTEYHGRVPGFQCEPCTPPHEPNFEYDLLAEHLVTAGEAFAIGAVANNDAYNSYVMPQRDYLSYTNAQKTATRWLSPWDDMSTNYTPQFAMLHGAVSYTVELPAYSEDTVRAVCYGSISQADYVKNEKLGFLTAQVKIYERSVNNANSNAYELVGQWFCDQNDVEGAEMKLLRPEYNGEGENGNFYPECYLIPLDGENQCNIRAARDMMLWLTRNDVKVHLTTEPIEYDGVCYPAGTLVVPMYQAKRSVANSALYDGTLLQSWTTIYSENITTFNETRGFHMATVAKPAEYERIAQVMGESMDFDDASLYADWMTSFFYGEEGRDVVILNDSEDATAAVNALLQEGKRVAMIVDGERKGDFICAYEDYLTVADRYLLIADGVAARSEGIRAQYIKPNPTVYITGVPSPYVVGCISFLQLYNSSWNYDRVAMENMNFKVTEILDEADVIAGANALNQKECEAVMNGTPCIGYGSAFLAGSNITPLVRAMGSVSRTPLSGAEDCLANVVYPNNTLVNASYISGGDHTLYGYSYEEGYCYGYFSSIPKGAVPLVAVDGSKAPTQGFIPASSGYAQFLKGGVLGFSFDNAKLHVALFANTLTNKGHQKDEYNYISNFIFSSLLTGEEYVGACSHIAEVEVFSATCTEGGYNICTCTICGEQYLADETQPLGHAYVDGCCIHCGEPEPVKTKLLLGAATGMAGDTVTISLSIVNNPGIAPFEPAVRYDTDKLVLLGIQDTGLLREGRSDEAPDGVIANLTFQIKEDCKPGEIVISLDKLSGTKEDALDASDGSIDVVDYLPGDLDGDKLLTVRDLALLRRYLLNGAAFPANPAAADLDGVPGVSEADVDYLRASLAHWEGYQPSYPGR